MAAANSASGPTWPSPPRLTSLIPLGFAVIWRARSLIDEFVARAVSASDIPDQCTAYSFESVFAILQNDAEEARDAAERLIAVAQEHGTKLFLLVARVYAGWAEARLDRSLASRKEFQRLLRPTPGKEINLCTVLPGSPCCDRG